MPTGILNMIAEYMCLTAADRAVALFAAETSETNAFVALMEELVGNQMRIGSSIIPRDRHPKSCDCTICGTRLAYQAAIRECQEAAIQAAVPLQSTRTTTQVPPTRSHVPGRDKRKFPISIGSLESSAKSRRFSPATRLWLEGRRPGITPRAERALRRHQVRSSTEGRAIERRSNAPPMSLLLPLLSPSPPRLRYGCGTSACASPNATLLPQPPPPLLGYGRDTSACAIPNNTASPPSPLPSPTPPLLLPPPPPPPPPPRSAPPLPTPSLALPPPQARPGLNLGERIGEASNPGPEEANSYFADDAVKLPPPPPPPSPPPLQTPSPALPPLQARPGLHLGERIGEASNPGPGEVNNYFADDAAQLPSLPAPLLPPQPPSPPPQQSQPPQARPGLHVCEAYILGPTVATAAAVTDHALHVHARTI
jgi:hypothetical protein